MVDFFKKVIKYVCIKLGIVNTTRPVKDTIQYWEKRSEKYGEKSVISKGQMNNGVKKMTQYQISEIFPYFKKYLTGKEKVVLDFGCGAGRFTKPLAEMINGKAIGVDPIETLIKKAPSSSNTEFHVMEKNKIPFSSNKFDILWICLVLGGVKNDELDPTIKELKRVVKPGGLICLVENTTDQEDVSYWFYRDVATYKRLFDFADLKHEHDYYDGDERISVLLGKVHE